MIIYGWGYYNRRQFKQSLRSCANCGHTGLHRSYTATRYATLYFVPFVPLGKIRVLCECPKCKGAELVPFREWKKLNGKKLNEVRQKWQANPSSRPATLEMMQYALYLGDAALFQSVASETIKRFSNDQEMIRTVAIGYECLLQPVEAQAAYLEAAELGGAEASSILQEAEDCASRAKIPPLRNPNRWIQSAPVMVVPSLLIALAIFIFSSLFVTGPKHAYAFNALEEPYAIHIDGKRLWIPPMSSIKLNVPYGPVTIYHASDGLTFDPISADLSVPYWERLFGKHVFLFNPDQSAFFLRQRLAYAVDVNRAEHLTTITPLVGQAFYRLSDIDHPFTEPPDEVSLSTSSSVAYREVLYFENEMDPLILASWMHLNGFPAESRSYLQRNIPYRPNRVDLLYTLVSISDARESLPYLRQLTLREPLEVEWHRAFQLVAEDVLPYNVLTQQYDTLLEMHPDDSRVHYLRARLCRDRKEYRQRIETALTFNAECAYSLYGTAWERLITGDFTAADEHIEQAYYFAQDNPMFSALRKDVKIALGKWDECIEIVQLKSGAIPSYFEDARLLVQALVLTGQENQVKGIIEAFIDEHADLSTEEIVLMHQGFELAIAESKQDRRQIVQLIERIEDAEKKAVGALLQGNPARAWQHWRTIEDPGYRELPLLFTIEATARINGNRDLARECVNAIRSILSTPGARNEQINLLIATKTPPSLDEVLALSYAPEQMRFFLYALGVRYPESRDVFFDHALILNYRPDAGKVLLESLINAHQSEV